MFKHVYASLGWPEFTLAVLSMCLCWLLILLQRYIPSFAGHSSQLTAVQAMHFKPTPRVGGIAIFAAFCVSFFFAPVSLGNSYGLFIMATSILFMVGLLEDLGSRVSPLNRLLAAVISSLAVILLLGIWLPRIDIPGLDALLANWLVGVPITVLLTAGLANGFNMIDGANGLASMTAITAAVALSLIADQAGYAAMVQLTMMLAAGILGFFLVNYPFGLIFLGDAGAYTLGFVLSWFGITILINAPEASPWAILLTMFWPIADMLLAIYRRYRRNADAMTPDRLHAHQMVMRGLEVCVLGRQKRKSSNPLSTLVLTPFVIAPPIAGVVLWDQSLSAFLAVLFFGALFFSCYAVAPVLIRRSRRHATRNKTKAGRSNSTAESN